MTDAVLTNQLNEAAATYMARADFAPGSVNAHVWPSLGLLTSRLIMVHCNNSRESERFSSMIFANPIPYGSVHRPSCFLAVLRIDIYQIRLREGTYTWHCTNFSVVYIDNRSIALKAGN